MLWQTADTVAASEVTGQPETVEPLKDKEEQECKEEDSCPAQDVVQIGRGDTGRFLYKGRESLKGI